MGGGGPSPTNSELRVAYPHAELAALRGGADAQRSSAAHDAMRARSSNVALDAIAQQSVERAMRNPDR